MFGIIFSLKNIIIFLSVIGLMSITMNSLETFKNKADSNSKDKFTQKNEEMYENVANLKEKFANLEGIINKTNELLQQQLELQRQQESNFTNNKEPDVDEEYENKRRTKLVQKFSQKRKKNRDNTAKFTEKFSGYNSNKNQDFMLLD
jgi:aspartate oxidase